MLMQFTRKSANATCRYLLYSSCQITTKPFVRDITEVGPYHLLFFGRSVSPNFTSEMVEIDGWIRYYIERDNFAICNFYLDLPLQVELLL
jgi:hypothetical protein